MTQQDRGRLEVLEKGTEETDYAASGCERTGPKRTSSEALADPAEGGRRPSRSTRTARRSSNRRLSEKVREKAVRILSQDVYRDFGPTLASEYLAKKHKVEIGREALRQLMQEGGLWRSRKQKVESIHQWRPRRSARGEMVQWDTSEHDWLGGRAERLYLIHMIDDATSVSVR